jgi:hypothetical protein
MTYAGAEVFEPAESETSVLYSSQRALPLPHLSEVVSDRRMRAPREDSEWKR